MLRPALIRASPAFAALVAGIAISALGNDSTALFIVGLALVGLGAVGLASLFFYEVGRSEDRERAREARRRPGG